MFINARCLRGTQFSDFVGAAAWNSRKNVLWNARARRVTNTHKANKQGRTLAQSWIAPHHT